MNRNVFSWLTDALAEIRRYRNRNLCVIQLWIGCRRREWGECAEWQPPECVDVDATNRMGLSGAAAILPATRQQQHEQLVGRWRLTSIAQGEGSSAADQSSHEVNRNNHSKESIKESLQQYFLKFLNNPPKIRERSSTQKQTNNSWTGFIKKKNPRKGSRKPPPPKKIFNKE